MVLNGWPVSSNYQNIEVQTSEGEIELPPIFLQAKDENSKMYTKEEIELVNCNLSEDGQNIILDEEMIEATITIKGGAIANSKLTIKSEDVTPPVLYVQYSTKEMTKESVIVTVTANEPIQKVDGWTLSNDKLTLTKEFSNNTEEELTIYDLVGNKTKIPIKISNIDKISPSTEVEYSTKDITKQTVKVTVKADERIQQVESWNLEEDGMTLTKVYAKNTEEEITVLDFAGNECKATISVTNIDTTVPHIKENEIYQKIKKIARFSLLFF